MSAADTLMARYNALWNRLATASTVAQMDAALAEWEASPDFEIPEGATRTRNQSRMDQLQSIEAGFLLENGVTLPDSYAAAKRLLDLHHVRYGSRTWNNLLEYGARAELDAWLDRARSLRANRLAELAHATATDTAKATETLSEVVLDLNDDVASLTDVVTFISDRVDMSAQERAEVVAALNNIRANRNAARATILGVLTDLRAIIDRAENGILPGATSPSGGGRGGVLILAAGAAAAWLALKG